MAEKEKKTTKREYFGMLTSIVSQTAEAKLPEGVNKADILNFISNEINLLDKKSNKAKETKTQAANSKIKAAIFTVLKDQTRPVTITELLEDERLKTYTEEDKDGIQTLKMSNQKLSAVMKMLVDAQEVVKTEDKKKSYFSLPKQADITPDVE